MVTDEKLPKDSSASSPSQQEKEGASSLMAEGIAKTEPPLAPEKNEKNKSGSASKAYIRVFSYTDKKDWWWNALAFAAMVVSGTLLPLMDIVFGKFVTVFNNFAIGVLTPDDYRREVTRYTLFFIYLFVAKFVLGYIWMVLISVTAVRTTKNLRITYLGQTLRQEVGYFDTTEAGSVSGSVTANGDLVNKGISEKLGLTVQATTTFVTAFIIAFAVQWKLTLIVIAIVPAILIVTGICIGIDVGNENDIIKILSRAGQHAEEVLSSMPTVHAFWSFSRQVDKYEGFLDEAKKEGMKKSLNYAVLFSVEFFCIFSGYALAFWQGIRMYQSGEVTEPGAIVTVIFAVIVSAQALTQIAPQMVALSKASAAAQDLFDVIDRESEIDSLSTGGTKRDECVGHISLKGVAFSYPSRPHVQVLKDYSIDIPARRTTAIVGASGSGKSTIVGLLERWFSPSAGSITLDGQEISEYNLQWLRTRIRLVQQEPVLFTGTIYENVANGLAGTSLADASAGEQRALVEDACKSAYAHEFIERLPQGYDTKIGQRGAMLSGGQKQRIAIARAIISNPSVLLLDEATSALDPTAEAIVQKALDNVAAGRTMVVIAHRLSTIRNADNIVVMFAGNIVEQGTHTQLVDAQGAYFRLVKAQDLGKGDEEEDGHISSDETAVAEGQGKVDNAAPLANAASLARTESAALGGGESDLSKKKNDPDVGLLKCIAIILGEQRVLWPAFAITILSCVLGGATYPGLAIVFSRTMDVFTLTGSDMTDRGDFWSLMFFVIALGNLVAYATLGWSSNVVAQGIKKTYRLAMFRDMLEQEMGFFDEPEHSTGALASRLSTEPDSLYELLSFNIGLIVINIVNVLSSCIVAIAYGWKLGLVLVLAALPPLVLSGYLRIRLEMKLDNDTSARFAESAGIASEAVLAIRTVSSLALEHKVLGQFVHSLDSIAVKAVKSLSWTMMWYALSQSISFLAMALGFWYGGQLISTGEYTATQFYAVFIATIFSGEAAAMFFQYTTSITKAVHAANYIFRLRKTTSPDNADYNPTPDSSSPTEKGTNHPAGVSVDCTDVHFAYPQRPATTVVKGVSASIAPGQFVGFVGASGCGKTTMISLLERFYLPTSGSISLDGRAASTVPLGRYRAGLALVQQEPVLYQGSIRDNIALGVPGRAVMDDEILAACRQANIETFIQSLPDGLATPCGSQGLQLSGGQRQRIAIARALIRKPRLLLLDEATSSLDTESERIVQAALDAAAKGEGEGGEGGSLRTTVAVAHRLSTIMRADMIFVFGRGRIVESGSHEELLEKKGVYYDMCLGQSLDRAVPA